MHGHWLVSPSLTFLFLSVFSLPAISSILFVSSMFYKVIQKTQPFFFFFFFCDYVVTAGEPRVEDAG